MRKWGITFSLLAALLGLAACGGPEQEVNILPYYYGYITTDGVLFGDTDGVYSVLCDEQGKQLYVLKSQSVYDYHSFNEAGNYEVVGFVFSVYDKNGVLQQRFEVDDADGSREFQFASSVGLFLPSNLDLNKAVLLLDMLGPQGRFQLLRADGRLLAEEKLPVDYKTSSFNGRVQIGDDFLAVNLSSYDVYYSDKRRAYLYDFSGRPLHQDANYTSVHPVYDFVEQRDSSYFAAQYFNPQGDVLYDVLDAKGQVVLSGLTEVQNCSGDLFSVRRGTEYGIINLAGEWVYNSDEEE